MASSPSPLPLVTARYVEVPDGVPSLIWRQYLTSVDALLRGLAGGNIGPLFNAVNDAAAAAGGVQIGGLYRNGGAVQIRLV